MNPRAALDAVALKWSRLITRNRDISFLVSIILSSMVAFLPFARETSVSNFLVYALLPLVLVFANRSRFERIGCPSGLGLLLALVLIAGSFAFNAVLGAIIGDARYGFTDYVILVSGIFLLHYSVGNELVQFGVVLLGLMRASTLALSVMYSSIFASVSEFFVDIVVTISRLFVSSEISRGIVPGQIIVGGATGGDSIFIGWACAGLEELALISVIMFVLIDSFGLSRRMSMLWLLIGIVGSFLVNILRMVILVWIAFERGIADMLWVHTHLGDLLFLAWVAAFWVAFFRIAPRLDKKEEPSSQSKG